MIAPISEPTNPAGSPARYSPIACPPYVASSDPAIPIAAVMKKPAGSRPGVSILASKPTTNPINMIQIMLMACLLSFSHSIGSNTVACPHCQQSLGKSRQPDNPQSACIHVGVRLLTGAHRLVARHGQRQPSSGSILFSVDPTME